MKPTSASFTTSCLVATVLATLLSTLPVSAVQQNGANAIRQGNDAAFTGTMRVLAVDYFDRPSETWYTLQLEDKTRISLDMSAVTLPEGVALYSGLTVTVAGQLQGNVMQVKDLQIVKEEEDATSQKV